MTSFLKKLWQDESGATAIEYGLIVGLMAAVLIGVLNSFGGELDKLFQAISDKLEKTTEKIKTDTSSTT